MNNEEQAAGDSLVLSGMVFYGHHGISEDEQKYAQKFVVDIVAFTPLAAAAADDELSATVDYAGLFRIASSVILGPSAKLVETLAERIAAKALKYSSRISRVKVSVKKVNPPLRGELDYAGVLIERSR